MKNKTRVPRDLDLKFLNQYVEPCPTDGYCKLVEGIERYVDPLQKLLVTRIGDIRNVWRIPVNQTPEDRTTYHFCIGCLHPIGHWETKRVNEYFGHKPPSIDDVLASLPEVDL